GRVSLGAAWRVPRTVRCRAEAVRGVRLTMRRAGISTGVVRSGTPAGLQIVGSSQFPSAMAVERRLRDSSNSTNRGSLDLGVGRVIVSTPLVEGVADRTSRGRL